MVDLNKIAKALRLFDEKAEKLSRLSFMEKMRHPDSGVTIKIENLKNGGSTVSQERRGPEEEAIDAFVLTFRYFIQDNETTSFRNMEQHYLAAPVDAALKEEFKKLRREINEYLDEPVGINYNNEDLTRRRIMDVFVYGGFSHANEEKRRLYKTWMSDPFMASFIENLFLQTIADIHNAIVLIKNLNDKALEHLPGPS
jgi:hypothetical protein